ncbi:MAG: phosphoglycerate kinase [Erysipelotrichales bacterium]|nr:phosphoglycerate kinase [Erysipelotrichales bacterium]
MKTVKDLQVAGKRVLVRCDFNVPLKDGAIRDDNRIVQALPTIKELISKGAKVILMSHLGKVDHKDPVKLAEGLKKNTLAPVAVRLGELLGKEVVFSEETRGEKLSALVNNMKDGDVLLVQNTRFEKGETKNDPELSRAWADLADAFVMDAFGSAHRAHASTYGVPELLKAEGKEVAVGYLVEKEVVNLSKVVDCKERPYLAILGGFKVSDKIKVINSLLKKCDKIIIGGAMAYTFIKALGGNVGTSPVEMDQLDYAREMYASGKILLPVDTVCANDFDNPTEVKVVESKDIPEGFEGLDIGPKTREMYMAEITKAKTIFWNGPMGVFEKDAYQAGTVAVCKACAELKGKAFTVIGGGDSAAACKQFGYNEEFSHVSTGGGASLEMIENDGHLPGIDVIG